MILERPASFPIVEQSVRRALVRRYPYKVFFVHEPPRIVILAILHAARRLRAILRERVNQFGRDG